ncbi:MAG TPA: tetratricopeptide repeat protein, partial [Spirochaetota bacterium]|nr:tetratricopeptide repeat protein [Spirochaetota bacterium]
MKTSAIKNFFIPLYIFMTISSYNGLYGQSQNKKLNILVYPFTNNSGSKYSWISAGMTQSVISDLAKISSISVFTEEDRKKAIQEIELAMTGLIKESDVPKVGELMGAELIFSGGYTVNGNKIRVTAKLISVENAAVQKAVNIDGTLDNLFQLQDKIVSELMKSAQETTPKTFRLPIITDEDIANIKKLPRPDMKAFELYAKGIEIYDRNPSEALKYFKQALSIDNKYYYALISAGNAYTILGNIDEAQNCYSQALAILQRAEIENSTEAASLYYSVGINFWNRGDYSKTISYASQAYNILHNSGESTSRLAAATLMLLGGGYRYINKVEEALKYTEYSLEIYKNLGLEKTSDYAWGLNNLAVTYSIAGDHKKPIELYKECIKIWKSLNLAFSMGTAYTYCQMGYEY